MTARTSPRKVIQVAAMRADVGSSPAETGIVALCDDGSIWTMLSASDGKWKPLPKIPQNQLFEDWCDDVADHLASRHLMRKDTLNGLLEQHRSALLSGHGSGQSVADTAAALAEPYK